ncbi:MAG: O-antigen ligase family protein [Elusimicrobiota bacterium]
MYYNNRHLSQGQYSSYLLALLLGFNVLVFGAVDHFAQVIFHLIIMLLTTVLVVVSIIKNDEIEVSTSTVFPLIILITLLLSYICSYTRWNSFPGLVNWICYLLLFLYGHRGKQWKDVVILNLVLTGMALSFIAVYQTVSSVMSYGKFIPATATLMNPNILAGFFVMMIPLIFALRESKTTAGKVEKILALAVLSTGLVLTGSIGAMLSLVLAAGGYYYFKLKKGTAKTLLFAVLGGMVIAILLVKGFDSVDITNRIHWWVVAGKMWISQIFTGIGIDNFDRYYQVYKIAGAENSVYAHSYYLQFLAECGILAFFVLVLGLIMHLVRAVKNVPVFIALTTVLIHNTFEYNLLIPGIACIFWYLLGVSDDNKSVFKFNLSGIPKFCIATLVIGIICIPLFYDIQNFVIDVYNTRGEVRLASGEVLPAKNKFLKALYINPMHSRSLFNTGVAEYIEYKKILGSAIDDTPLVKAYLYEGYWERAKLIEPRYPFERLIRSIVVGRKYEDNKY